MTSMSRAGLSQFTRQIVHIVQCMKSDPDRIFAFVRVATIAKCRRRGRKSTSTNSLHGSPASTVPRSHILSRIDIQSCSRIPSSTGAPESHGRLRRFRPRRFEGAQL